MRRALLVVAALTAIFSVGVVSSGQSAELELKKRYVSREDCDHSGCKWHGRYPRCPDRFSCYPLYGAYGPYGGVGYWATYSFGYDYYAYR